MPAPLYSYLLCVTRSTTGADTVAAVHRLILSCPGDDWCHRGGCPDRPPLDVAELLAPIVAAGVGVAAAIADDGWAWDAFQRLYGSGDMEDYADTLLEWPGGVVVQRRLGRTGAVDVGRRDGGTLLRRGEHCLTASYDPVTRQIRLADGRSELEMALDMLAEDGVLTGDDGAEIIDMSDEVTQRWGRDMLTAAEDLLRGRISELPFADGAVQGALLGLHPHADGRLYGPASTTLVEGQLTALLRTIDVLRDSD